MQFPDTNNINSRESFIEFVGYLHADLIQNKEKWENSTLETFLETLAQYARDIQGYYDYATRGINTDNPSWKVFADMLAGASIMNDFTAPFILSGYDKKKERARLPIPCLLLVKNEKCISQVSP